MHLGHGHDHAHDHSGHMHINRSFAIAVVLNILLVIGEAIGGLVSGSMALLADAGHNLSDVAGLILAWCAHWLRGKGSGARWTYGFRSFTILAANLNGVLIVAAIVGVSIESIRRLFYGTEVAELPVIVVALVAAVLNFATARLLSHSGEDLNIRGAYLHMMADAAVSLSVVVGALVMLVSGWSWLDPAISLAICVVLAIGTFGLLSESTSMMMHAAPRKIDLEEVRQFLLSNSEVDRIDDLHVWSVSTSDVLLTTRLLCPRVALEAIDPMLEDLHEGLRAEFGISHATIEITRGGVKSCQLAPEGIGQVDPCDSHTSCDSHT